jgi:hypothetical protein
MRWASNTREAGEPKLNERVGTPAAAVVRSKTSGAKPR